ncbi:MAG: NAD-dependent epimerase/dehydratase family protein [Chitinophagales bacterium]
MVVGSGMLAKAFERFRDDASVIIFASGVSNSSEDDPEAFEREKNLLQSFAGTPAKLVYFSTISIEDPEKQNSNYIRHKLQIEKLIQQSFMKYLIFRLPNLVGRSDNLHTLTNFIYHRIKNELMFPVFANAKRYLMDVDDVASLLSPLISEKEFVNRSENIFFDDEISIPDLVKTFENLLDKKAQVEIIEKGSSYHPDDSFFKEYLQTKKITLEKKYCEKLIKKYYSEP